MRVFGTSYRSRYIPIFDKEGNFKHLRRDSNGLLYDIPRKQYTRTHPYPTIKINNFGKIEPIKHFKALPREKSAILMMRRLGSYSINQLSQASGKSSSWIHKIIKQAQNLGSLPRLDNRKLPRKAILYSCKKKLISCFSAFQMWLPFILGEEEEPP